MAIITISRTLGSFGNEIAQALADEFDYHLLTRENASAMLLDSGFSESHVSTTFSEAGRPSLFEHFAADRDRLTIHFGDILVATNGWVAPDYREEDGAAYMKRSELAIAVDLGLGAGAATIWTCDLTHRYIAINADYRS